MSFCDDHRPFRSRSKARAWRRILVRRLKNAGDTDYKLLNVFRCKQGHWHVGRSNPLHREKAKPVKAPSPGALRRKADRELKAMRRYVDRVLRQCLREYLRDILAE